MVTILVSGDLATRIILATRIEVPRPREGPFSAARRRLKSPLGSAVEAGHWWVRRCPLTVPQPATSAAAVTFLEASYSYLDMEAKGLERGCENSQISTPSPSEAGRDHVYLATSVCPKYPSPPEPLIDLKQHQQHQTQPEAAAAAVAIRRTPLRAR